MGKLNSVTFGDIRDLWKHHSLWVILLIAAFAFDTLSTIHFMTNGNIHYEFHPLIRYSALTFGPVIGTILSAFLFKIFAGLWLALYLKPLRVWILIAPMITSTIAGFLNYS